MELQRGLILKSFLVESSEGLTQMEQAILELETRPEDLELIQSIFRVVHTAKGNAGILELHSLLTFAHSLEDLLDEVRKQNLRVTPEIVTLLFASLDVLREMTSPAGAAQDTLSERAKDVLEKISAQIESNGGRTKENTPDGEAAAAMPVASGTAAKSSDSQKSLGTLRVGIEKLDRLLNLTGEITIARGRITQLLEGNGKVDVEEIREAHRLADTLHTELQETVLKARMVAVGPMFRQYARMVRDLAKSHGKLAHLLVEGEDVEVDTTVVEHLKDPLLHMIRNAIDHGIEPPAVRKKSGKTPSGTITVRASHQGGNVVIEVEDDGAGLSRQRIIETAQKRGMVAEPEKLADSDLFLLIFEAGFSTASEINDLSGRGVGMDVVRRNVQALRGSVNISSRPGAGSTIHIRLPLTLAIIEGFGVGVGTETYVIPVDQVLECVELPRDEHDAARTYGVLQLRGQPLPYLYLKDHFGLSGERGARQNIVVVQHDTHRAGLAVDVLYGATQTVIKPLARVFKDIPGVSGSAILGNGRVALILDVPALIRSFQMETASAG